MRAVRIGQVAGSPGPYSAENPAPLSALFIDNNVPIPQPIQPGQVLVRVHAATVTRDELTWPETYRSEHSILGHDFAGEVISIASGTAGNLHPGDQVYGMTATAGAGSTWAEFAVVHTNETSLKPRTLDWTSSATIPMSALTAWQALFVQAGVSEPDLSALLDTDGKVSVPKKSPHTKLLVTGASGAVGAYIVQLAALAGVHVTAASTSNDRNEHFLLSLGADEAAEYQDLFDKKGEFDIIIDTVGGQTLANSWGLVTDTGSLITIDSLSFDFVEKQRELPLSKGKENVNARFFIVEASNIQLQKIASAVDLGLLRTFVAQSFPLDNAGDAYEAGGKRVARRGKIVLTL